MEREFLNPPDLPNWQRTFSQVAVVRSGAVRLIWVAGQVSVDEKNNRIGEGDLETQAKQAFRNWAAGVRFANGGEMSNTGAIPRAHQKFSAAGRTATAAADSWE